MAAAVVAHSSVEGLLAVDELVGDLIEINRSAFRHSGCYCVGFWGRCLTQNTEDIGDNIPWYKISCRTLLRNDDDHGEHQDDGQPGHCTIYSHHINTQIYPYTSTTQSY